MTMHRFISALLLSTAAVLPAAAASGRDAITTEQIAAAMANAGMQVSPKQVDLLTDVVANTPSPVLKIRSMEPLGDRRMMVRLDCESTDECLPFFVAVRFNQGDDAQAVAAKTVAASSENLHTKSPAATPTLRAGAPATLLLDGGRVHIRLTVVCLENGSIGQIIRVASKDHKEVYTALIVDDAVLKARL
jgi:hypothetical protein